MESKVPLVIVPTTYNSLSEKEMIDFGVDIVIHANHLLRTSYKAMKEVAEIILETGRSCNVNNKCCSVQELFALTNRDVI